MKMNKGKKGLTKKSPYRVPKEERMIDKALEGE
jgi:hypothetical protein